MKTLGVMIVACVVFGRVLGFADSVNDYMNVRSVSQIKATHSSNIIKTKYYSISGKKLPDPNLQHPGNNVVIKKEYLSNGTIQHKRTINKIVN